MKIWKSRKKESRQWLHDGGTVAWKRVILTEDKQLNLSLQSTVMIKKTNVVLGAVNRRAVSSCRDTILHLITAFAG